MTDTEKILNLIEINETIPALVTDEDRKIISCNQSWTNEFGHSEIGKNFNKLFDRNTSLLIKNSFIDAKAFLKIQRRVVDFKVNDVEQSFKLLLSPFKIESKLYIYVLLYNFVSQPDDLLVYPTIDKEHVNFQYEEIISLMKKSLESNQLDRKKIQPFIDIEKVSIAIKSKQQFLLVNNNIKQKLNIDEIDSNSLSHYADKLYPPELLAKIKLVENELFLSHCLFVIEKKDYANSSLQQGSRLLLYPVENNNGKVEYIMIVGSIDLKSSSNKKQTSDIEDKEDKSNNVVTDSFLEESGKAKIIYDKSDFTILEANESASELYGYELNTLKQMDVTQLFSPEDMQKLLVPADKNSMQMLKHVNKIGETIEVNVERKNILWDGKEACEETITPNLPEEEVIKLEETTTSVKSSTETIVQNTSAPKDSTTEFLSSLFHELLTPVNVILGFVQEIIDSIDNRTEEQEESAQIIKDNQQILLQTMNTAVQYAKLDENKIKLNIDEFDLNNYLVDLQDSFSKTSDEENVDVIFDEMPDSLSIKHDRSKLLAAISYFIKFFIKLTDSSKIFVSFQSIGDDFFVIVKDTENGISKNVSADLLEIYNAPSLNSKKNYGISPIILKLAKRVNEILSVKVEEYSDSNGVLSIALVVSANTGEKPIPKHIEAVEDIAEPEDKNILEGNENVSSEEVINSESRIILSDEQVITGDDEIATGEIDEKINEDIEEEKEIVTEEIATVETHNHNILNFSTLSCLFIDDNVDTQLLFKSQMKDFKLLKVCSNFTDALPLFSKYNFDLIVVDVNLNDTYNGLDVLKIVRQFKNFESTPIIATTAYPFEGDKDKFISFGFTDYLVKPLLREQLIQSLDQIMA